MEEPTEPVIVVLALASMVALVPSAIAQEIEPPPPSVGTNVPASYFGPFPSQIDRKLVGPVQLLRSGTLDIRKATIEIPLYLGHMTDGRNVWYILTDTSDKDNAEALGLNHSGKLHYSNVGRATRSARLNKRAGLIFEKGTVDFAPDRKLVPGRGANAFPPRVATPGSVGDADYTPLVRIENAGGHVYNAPVVAFDKTAEAGRVLLGHAETVLDRLADAEAELQAVADRRGGRLRFGCFPTATLAFGARLSEAFRARYPDIDFQYIDGEPFQSLLRLRQRELELIFDFDRWPAGVDYDAVLVCPDDDVAYIDLFDDPFFLVLPPSHRLGRRRTVQLAELRDELILGYGPWGSDLEHLCAELGFEPRFDASYHTADFDSFEAFVALGRGVTLMPGLALETRSRTGIAVRPLQPTPTRHVKLAHRLNAHLSPGVEAMIEMIAAEVRSPAFRAEHKLPDA
ncbi:MAG: LysR substrate-binding domain-containing protein [Actinomycetota bacterium]|nr:LysR substrate-binding domain-containing protein [Actinomycetota bacterium]